MSPPDARHALSEDRPFIENEATVYLRALHSLLPRGAFEVNPRVAARAAAVKPLQLIAAKKVGLSIPDTIISNSPEEIKLFHSEHKGKIVYKALQPHNWAQDDGLILANVVTSRVPSDSISNAQLLSMCPGIYQPELDRTHEYRVTIIGNAVYCAKTYNSNPNGPDWRGAGLTISDGTADVSSRVIEKCRELMHDLGLVFGCIDFSVTKGHAEPVFLEVNEMGQWLYIEKEIPHFQMLRTFGSLLVKQSTANNSLLGTADGHSFSRYTASVSHQKFRSDFVKRARVSSRFSTVERRKPNSQFSLD